MDVSIILVNYNTLQMTEECIKSIEKWTEGVSYEIILVDNASADGSKDYFSNRPNIIYIYSEKNLGFGCGNNFGYNTAKGKYLFLLNTDTILLNNAVKIFYDYMEQSDNTIGCIGCVLSNKNLEKMHSYGRFPSYRTVFYRIIHFWFPHIVKNTDIPKSNVKYPLIVDYITGADIFMRKKIADTYGLFDPDFFMYYEETEMQNRYLKAGYKSIVIDTPQIMHLQGGSSEGKKSLKSMIRDMRSFKIYLDKTSSCLKKKILCLMQTLLIPRIWTKREVMMSEKKELTKIIINNL